MSDIYQDRYLEHQARKARSLMSNFGTKTKPHTKQDREAFFRVLSNRCSQRAFNDEPIDLKPILWAVEQAPSSCGRKGVGIRIITERDNKDILSGILVGGVGWCHRGKAILLLVADMRAYKNPAERDFMPYLDAGVIVQTIYLTCEAINYGCCFVNPNIRTENQEFFKKRFLKNNELFCGAMVLGKYDLKHS